MSRLRLLQTFALCDRLGRRVFTDEYRLTPLLTGDIGGEVDQEIVLTAEIEAPFLSAGSYYCIITINSHEGHIFDRGTAGAKAGGCFYEVGSCTPSQSTSS